MAVGLRHRLRKYRTRIVSALRESFDADHSPKEIARSFSIGVFITMLPTLGSGILVFFLLVRLFSWMNKIAIFASVVVVNPVVKWGVYAASLSLGFLLVGPIDGVAVAEIDARDISLATGSDILIRLLVGNLILAVIAAVIAYFAVHRMVIAYHERETDAVGEAVDTVLTELDEDTA